MKMIIQPIRNIIVTLRAAAARPRLPRQRAGIMSTTNRPTHCSNILTLLAHLCDMDEEARLWVLRWLAYPLRNPGAKMATGLIFNGGEASGKTVFFSRVIGELYGANAAQIRPRDLHSNFNPWVVGANLVVVDGEFARRHIARMKAFMTATPIVLEVKGQATRTIANHLNFVYLSSRDDFLPIDTGNRRFVVVEVPPARPRAFYEAVLHEIADGGIDAFRHYLLHVLVMGDFNESTLPPAVLQGDWSGA